MDRTYFDLLVFKCEVEEWPRNENKHKLILVNEDEDDDRRKMDRNMCVLLIVDKQCHFMFR